MTTSTPHAVDVEALLDALPEPLVVPGALARIAEHARRTGTRTVALDDDPTGTQTLRGVRLVSRWTDDDLRWALGAEPGVSVALTNTRSMSRPDTTTLVHELAWSLERLAAAEGWPLRLVARGDSTLRGHVPLETDVLAQVAAAHGRPYDAVLFTPAYLEAGRMTVGDVQWVDTPDGWIMAGDSEYAADATFGYRSSDLRDYLDEKSGGRWPARHVTSISLETIRSGGPDAVLDRLLAVTGGAPVVVNAASVHDLEVVALAVIEAEEAGRRLLHRLAPSLLRVLAGQPVWPALTDAQLAPAPGHGLIVVGSHTANTTRQLARLEQLPGLRFIELDVAAVLASPDEARAEVSRVVGAVIDGLAVGDVVLQTGRTLVTATGGRTSLEIAGAVSTAVTDVVRAARAAGPLGFVVAKGGITSHDVAVHGLGIARAVVAGQIFDGVVSVLTTVEADVPTGMPYVVFPGNVGSEDSLASVIRRLRPTSAEGGA